MAYGFSLEKMKKCVIIKIGDRMNKKGFTLVELLAVIVILALLALVAYPNVTKIISDAKGKTKTIQMASLEKAAETYVAKHADTLGDSEIICVSTLKKDGLIENTKVVNPEDNSEYVGYFTITWNTTYNQYDYSYTNSTHTSCN